MSKRRGTMKTTRLRKIECPTCGAIARVSRAVILNGMPLCGTPGCTNRGDTMVCADPADAIECGLMSLDELPRPLRTAICKANGWEDEIVRTNRAQTPGFRAKRKPEPAIPF